MYCNQTLEKYRNDLSLYFKDCIDKGIYLLKEMKGGGGMGEEKVFNYCIIGSDIGGELEIIVPLKQIVAKCPEQVKTIALKLNEDLIDSKRYPLKNMKVIVSPFEDAS